MADMRSALDATGINDAIVKANLHRLYPEGIDLPREGKETIIGGDVHFPVVPQPVQRSNAGWIVASLLGFVLLLAIGIGVGYWLINRPAAPGHDKPPATSTPGEDFRIDFFDP